MKDKKLVELWGHIHWLGVLEEQGSYTAAAKRLQASKAAVSQRIAELESVLGIELVRRSTRSVALTDAGRRLVADTRPAFDQIADSFVNVSVLADQPRGALRVTAPVAFSRQHLVPLLPDFMQRYPDVRIELVLSDELVSIAREGFDLAIRHTYENSLPETHVAWPLFQTRSMLVASPRYLRKMGEPAHPDELLHHRCLHYPRPKGAITWSFESVKRKKERITVPLQSAFAANNSEVLRDLAAAGEGVALAPSFSVHAAIRQGALTEVMTAWRPVGAFGDHVFALRPYSAHVPLPVRVFVEYLRERFAQGFALS